MIPTKEMSKIKGTNITAPTVEGYGRINKIWGHTIEEGSGEKSPTNPYTLRCVGDDMNLFNANKIEQGAKNGITCTVSNGVMTFNGTCTQDNTGFVAIFNNLVKNINGKTNIFIEYISGTIENATNTTVYSMFQQGFEHQMYSKLLTQNMKSISNFDNNFNFYAVQIRFDNGVKANNYKIRVKVSQVNTDVWSPYNYGTIENVSQNGDQQSSNTVVTKPLCCLKDGDNVVAQDYIDYTSGKVRRKVERIVLTGEETTWSGRVGNAEEGTNKFRAQLALNYVSLANTTPFSNYFESGNVVDDGAEVFTQASNTVSILRNNFSTDATNEIIYFCLESSRFSTIDAFKAFLKEKYQAGNPVVVLCERNIELEEPLDCSNKIVQYVDKTTVLNRDGAEIEASLTNNEAIAEVNGEFKNNEIQTITNENGTAIKFPNGMSICSFFGERATGSTYGDVIWNYPMPFKEAPVVLGLAGQGENYAVLQMMLNSPGTNMAVVQFLQNNSYYVSKKAKFSIVAIGRWK